MFKSGILVMIVTLISRVLGLGRSMVVAYYFGANAATDAFFSAFKIVTFLDSYWEREHWEHLLSHFITKK